MSRAQLTSTVEQNSAGAASPFLAGKNKIINGDFGIWQRGTSFTPLTNINMYTTDRWSAIRDGTGATVTVSQQAFTPGTAPVAGYESTYFYRHAQTVAGSGGTYQDLCRQPIEDVKTLAGQTVTVSAWIKSTSTNRITFTLQQNFGTGGSSSAYTQVGTYFTPTTSWVRYSQSVTLPSIAGKTIGTGSALILQIGPETLNTVQTVDIWGVQIEAGSVATPFTTASGTLQGELALCQRYFVRKSATAGTDAPIGTGVNNTSTSLAGVPITMPVTMRTAPSFSLTGSPRAYDGSTAPTASVATYGATVDGVSVSFTSSGLIAGRPSVILAPSAGTANYDFSAEL